MSWLTTETLFDLARYTAGVAANWWIQSALLIAAGLAVGALCRRRGSAVQSAVYRTTLAAVIAAPLVTWGLNLAGVQGWSVEMPTAWSRLKVETPAVFDAAEAASDPSWAAIGDGALAAMQQSDEPPMAERINAYSLDGAPITSNGSDDLTFSDTPPALASPSLAAPTPPAQVPLDAAPVFTLHRFGWIAAAASAAWILVAAALVARLAVACRRLGRIRRRAAPADRAVQDACRELASQLRVAPPAVLRSPYLPSPCLTGLRRPAVLLPEASGDLPMRDVLAHELAHLSRGDCYWNLLRQLAGAVLYFQPLMWRLSRRLEAAAEEVCDDYVVHLGGDRRGYAHRLVDIAELSLAPFAPAGVGIVSLRSMLGQRVARIMDTSRSLSTRVGGALLAMVLVGGLVGTLAAGLVGLSATATAVTAADDANNAADQADSKDTQEPANPAVDDDVITVRGQVVDPDSKPMPNVDVYALRWYWNEGEHKPLSTTKADAEGRFEISYRKSQFAETAGRPNQWREVYIASMADGYGPGWAHYDRLKPGEAAVVKLAVDDVPIEGRVIDLEGNPVVGAAIEVGNIAEPKGGSLDGYVGAITAGQAISTAYAHIDESLPHSDAVSWSKAVTDADGRFRLTGLGRERRVTLHVSGPTIVTKSINAATRMMEPIVHPAYDYKDADDTTQYGARFEFTAAPSRAIEGVVRDAESGGAIAGAEIWSWKFAGEDISGITTVRTKSDADGRFRLEGMPKGDGNRVVVVPADLPYFTAEFDAPNPPGTEPAPLDVELHRGVWVTGRVTDKATGEPVSAHIHYIAFPDNQLAHDLKEFEHGRHGMSVQDRFRTDADGRYRVVALPGHGIIGVKAVLKPYPGGQGYHDIDGIEDRESFMKLNGVFAPIEKSPTAVKEIRIGDHAMESVCDFELDPGGLMTLRTVDPDGAPLAGVQVTGVSEIDGNMEPMAGAEFDLVCFRPGENRTVLLYQPERQLGKALRVKPDEAGDGPLTIELQPVGAVLGRLVNDGEPVTGATLRIDVAGDNDYGRNLRGAATDSEGRFRHEEILPGLKYTIFAEGAGMEFTTVAKELEVQPGETVDLGTIDIAVEERPEPIRTAAPANRRAPSTTPADEGRSEDTEVIAVRGQVLDPDGRPVPQATVRLPDNVSAEVPTTHTDDDGRFEIAFDKTKFTQPPWHREPWRVACLYATAEGFAPAWLSGNDLADDLSPTLELQRDDVPVRGQVLDLEGQPVPQARLEIWDIHEPHSGSLDGLLETVRDSPGMVQLFVNREMRFFRGSLLDLQVERGTLSRAESGNPLITTDGQGRFECRGIGRERLARLWLEGPHVESTQIRFITRSEIDDQWQRRSSDEETQMILDSGAAPPQVYAATFKHFTGPSSPISGVVRDKESGEPIAGIRVNAWLRNTENHADATTDENGRYTLTGLAVKGTFQQLYAGPNEQDLDRLPYLGAQKSQISFSPGAPLSNDDTSFELTRGILVRGRVTEAGAPQPVKARVEYLGYGDNPHLQALTDDLWPYGNAMTEDNGEFTIAVMPGPGALAVSTRLSSDLPDRYRPAAPDDFGLPVDERGWMSTTNHGLIRAEHYQAAQFIDLRAGEQPADVSLTVEPLTDVVRVRCVDMQGRPLRGVSVAGHLLIDDNFRLLSRGGLEVGRGADAYIEISDLGAESRRPVVFLHGETNVAVVLFPSHSGRQPKLADLERDEEGAYLISLTPCASMTGRLVDENGDPLRDGGVELHLADGDDPRKSGIEIADVQLDDNGRFTLRSLPAGGPYILGGGGASHPSRQLKRDITIKSGETIALGTIEVTDNERPEPKRAGGINEPVKATAAVARAPAESQLRVEDEPASVVRGRVLGIDGKPVAGADVAVTAMRNAPRRGGDFGPNGDVLAEAQTDADGAFEMALIGASSKTHQYPMIIVRARGAALGWRKLDLDAAETVANFELAAEAPIAMRLVDIEGQPATGARVQVQAVMKRSLLSMLVGEEGVGFRNGSKTPAAWIPALVADFDGRIEIPHLAENFGVALQVDGDERFAPQDLAINTGMPEQRGEHDGTYRSLVFNDIGADGAKSIPLAPAQLFTGTVTYEDTGQPAPHARLTVWASQQEKFGSMSSVAGQADEQGRYQISPNPGIRFGVTAYPPDGTPYLLRTVTPIAWQGGDKSRQVDVKLPRGVLVRGQVLELGTNQPVAGASVQYVPESANNPRVKDDIITGWQGIQVAGNDGRFHMAVMPGPGRLLVHGPGGEYVLQETSGQELDRGVAGGERSYAHAVERIDPAEGAEPFDVSVFIQRGQTVRGEFVDGGGAPVDRAIMVSRQHIGPTSLRWRGHSEEIIGGRFEASGLLAGQELPLHFLDARRKIGATVVVRAGVPPRRVVLQPCGRVTMRLVDEEGQPVPDREQIIQFVATPGVHQFSPMAREAGSLAADADFIQNVDQVNHKSGPMMSDADGRLVVDALIPGATYRVVSHRDGEFGVAKDFVAEAGKALDLGDLVVERRED